MDNIKSKTKNKTMKVTKTPTGTLTETKCDKVIETDTEYITISVIMTKKVDSKSLLVAETLT